LLGRVLELQVGIVVVNLQTEELGTDSVVAPHVLLITVEALPVASTLVHLCWREAADRAPCDRHGAWARAGWARWRGLHR
jgi:hypothetical protein